MKKVITRRLVTLSGLVMLGLFTAAHAALPLPYGWYVEGNVGGSQEQGKSYPGSTQTRGFGWNVDAGYKFMPYLGAEIGYTGYYHTNINAPSGSTAGQDNHYSYDFAGKGILPIADYGIELFGKLGIAGIQSNVRISNSTAASSIGLTSSSNNTTGLYMAVGAEYYVLPQMAVNGQWARVQGNSNTGNLTLLSVGLSFLFDY